MSDTPPDRLSISPKSPYFSQESLQRGVRINFKGKERHDVEEYSMSEGWIRVALGKKVDRHGQPLTIKLTGEVEAWFADADDSESSSSDSVDEASTPDEGATDKDA